jgi:type IV pilus assembly protein PilN
MQFRVNLATRQYINTRQLNLGIGILFILLVGLSLFAVRAVATNKGEIERVSGEIARLDKARGTVTAVPEKEYQAILDRIQFANRIIANKSYNWLLLLDRLEEVVPGNVVLTSIEPDTKEGSLKLTGTARNFSNLRRFMENLEASKFFTETYLNSQSEAKVSDRQKGLAFNISCKVASR